MDIIASLAIPSEKPIEEVVESTGRALGLVFSKDTSGRYEEFPAFVADAIGVEFALLKIPSPEFLDEGNPVENYSMLVRSVVEAGDDSIETDLSVHLQAVLNSYGLNCSVGNA